MTPYYTSPDGKIVLYCGDCREILPTLPKTDAVITDPPYNVGKDYGGHNDSMTDEDYAAWAAQIVAAALSAAPNQFWVAPRYKLSLWLSLLPSAHLVVIRRGASGPFRGGWSDQFEIALACGKPSRCIPDLWEDIRLKGEGYFFREETYSHPGYTPSGIMKRAITLFSETSIIEPFAGTGTTLVCAAELERSATGIELNEAYCKIAAERLTRFYAQRTLDFKSP